MTWFRIDDTFHTHPKVLALRASKHGKGSLALWTLAGTWSSQHLTDGHIPAAAVPVLGGLVAEAEALVAVGLWTRTEDGYAFHDWLDRNPSRTRVQEKREQQRERVTRHREKRDSNALQAPSVTEGVTPPPSRPVPTRPPSLRSDPRVSESAARVVGLHRTPASRAVLMAAIARRHAALLPASKGIPESIIEAIGEGRAPSRYAHDVEQLERLAEWAEGDDDPEALVGRVLDGAHRDDWMRSKALPLKALAGNPAKFLVPTSGRVEPLPNGAYRGSSDDEIREAFGDVSDEELAWLDGPRRRHG